MSKCVRSRGVRVWVVALYALAMLLVGAVQKGMLTESALSGAATAYALPDGSMPGICSTGGSSADGKGEQQGQHADMACCDACLLVSAAGLPVAELAAVSLADFPSVTYIASSNPGALPRSTHAPQSRDPPRQISLI
jgi:hypothetical protein